MPGSLYCYCNDYIKVHSCVGEPIIDYWIKQSHASGSIKYWPGHILSSVEAPAGTWTHTFACYYFDPSDTPQCASSGVALQGIPPLNFDNCSPCQIIVTTGSNPSGPFPPNGGSNPVASGVGLCSGLIPLYDEYDQGWYNPCAGTDTIDVIPSSWCGVQDLPLNASGLYITKKESDSAGGGVFVQRHNGLCITFDSAYTLTVPASGGLPYPPSLYPTIKPKREFPTCIDCVDGIMLGPDSLCPGQFKPKNAPELFMPASCIPSSNGVIKYKGYCFYIDVAATRVKRTRNAIPICICSFDYTTCEGCKCGDKTLRQGIKAVPCPGNEANAKDVWVEDCLLPATKYRFQISGVCYTINPFNAVTNPLKTIPLGALTVQPTDNYHDCAQCLKLVGPPENGNTPGDDDDPTDDPNPDGNNPTDDPRDPTGGGGSGGGGPWYPPGGGICFISDTPITMSDSSKKSISDINVGDLVLSFNTNLTTSINKVIGVYKGYTDKLIKVDLETGLLYCTENHPFYVGDGLFVKAKDLGSFTTLFAFIKGNISRISIKSISIVEQNIEVFNITVENDETYFANNVAVHNKTPVGTGEGPDKTPPITDPPINYDSVIIRDCTTDSALGPISKKSGLAGKIIRLGETCYRVTTEGTTGGGDITVDKTYSTCVHCEIDNMYYQLKKCVDDTYTAYFVKVLDWNQCSGGLKTVTKIGDDCCYAVKTRLALAAVQAVPGYSIQTPSVCYNDCSDVNCLTYDCGNCNGGCCFSSKTKITVSLSDASPNMLSAFGFSGDDAFNAALTAALNGKSGVELNPLNPIVGIGTFYWGDSNGITRESGWAHDGWNGPIPGPDFTLTESVEGNNGDYFIEIGAVCTSNSISVVISLFKINSNFDEVTEETTYSADKITEGSLSPGGEDAVWDCCGIQGTYTSEFGRITGTVSSTVSDNGCCKSPEFICVKGTPECSGDCSEGPP